MAYDEDLADRKRYLNARSTIAKLLEWRAVPVINENDTVATNEIRYGDNDRLAARVAERFPIPGAADVRVNLVSKERPMIRMSLPLNSMASRKSWLCRMRPLKVLKPGNSGTFGSITFRRHLPICTTRGNR